MDYSTASASTSASVSFITPTYPVETEDSTTSCSSSSSPTHHLCKCNKTKEITVDDDYVTLIQLEGSTTTQLKISIDDFPELPFAVDRSIDDDEDDDASSEIEISSIHHPDTYLIAKAPAPLSHNEVNRRNEERRSARATLLSSRSEKRTKLSKKIPLPERYDENLSHQTTKQREFIARCA